MSQDIARLGFDVDTESLDAASKSLDRLSDEAAQAEVAARRHARTQATAAATIARAAAQQATAAYQAARASGTATAATLASLRAQQAQATAAYSAAQANATAATAALQVAQANVQIATTANQAAAGQQSLAQSQRAVGLTAGQQSANLTNMAAQFQDIGVTAAAGMSPALIAMQQGTQISLVMGEAIGRAGLAGGLRLLGSAFLGLLHPLNLAIIGMVGLLAAGVQMVNWTEVARTSLLFVADVLPQVATGLAYVGAMMAVAFAPQILTSIRAMTIAIGVGLVGAIRSATVAMVTFSLANPFTAFMLALGLALAAAILFRNQIRQYFGVDIVQSVMTAADNIVGGFVGGFNAVRAVWRQLPGAIADAAITAANRLVRAVATMLLAVRAQFSSWISSIPLIGQGLAAGMEAIAPNIPQMQFENPYAGMAQSVNDVAMAEIRAAQGQRYFTRTVEAGAEAIGNLQDMIRGWANSLGGAEEAERSARAAREASGRSEETNAEKFARLIAETDRRIAQLQREGELIGMVGEARRVAAARNDLLNRAAEQGIILGETEIAVINAKAAALGRLEQQQENLTRFNDMSNTITDNITALQSEIAVLDMTAAQTAEYMLQRQLANLQLREGITFTNEQIEALRQQTMAEAELTAELERQRSIRESFREIGQSVSDAFKGMLTAGKSWRDGMRGIIQSVIDQLWQMFVVQQIVGFISKALGAGVGDVVGMSSSSAVSIAGARANGGPVGAGQTYLVGEEGPELFTPRSSGMIVPNSQLGQSEKASSQINVSVDARGATDPEAVRRQVEQGIIEAAPAIIAAAEERTVSNLRRPRLGGGMQ